MDSYEIALKTEADEIATLGSRIEWEQKNWAVADPVNLKKSKLTWRSRVLIICTYTWMIFESWEDVTHIKCENDEREMSDSQRE